MRNEEDYAYVDLRVDEHPQPVAELRRVFGVFLQQARPFIDGRRRTWWRCCCDRRPSGRLNAERVRQRLEIGRNHVPSLLGPAIRRLVGPMLGRTRHESRLQPA